MSQTAPTHLEHRCTSCGATVFSGPGYPPVRWYGEPGGDVLCLACAQQADLWDQQHDAAVTHAVEAGGTFYPDGHTLHNLEPLFLKAGSRQVLAFASEMCQKSGYTVLFDLSWPNRLWVSGDELETVKQKADALGYT